MPTWLLLLLGIPLSLVALALLYSTIREARYQTQARRHGCAPARRFPHKEPVFGLDGFLAAGEMFSKHTFHAVNYARYAALGPTFEMKTFGTPTICSADPDNIQSVFASNAKNWGVGYRLPALDAYCGKGFLTTDGREWQRSRQLFSHSFARANIVDHGSFEHYLGLLIGRIPEGEEVDLQTLIFSLYLDTATLFLFGTSFDSLARGLSAESQSFIDSFAYSLGGGGLRMALGPLKFLHRDSKWAASNAQNHAFVDQYVERALALRAEGKSASSSARPVLLDLMAEDMAASGPGEDGKPVDGKKEGAAGAVDRVRLRNEATHAFVAAHETTACLISNIMWALARHPHVWAAVQAEARALPAEQLTFEGVQRHARYVQNVVNETLRLYTVFPYHLREAAADCVLPNGGGPEGKDPVFVRAGSLFDANFAVLHRRKDLWGEDAEEFRPERWEASKPAPWQFAPFGGGPRACVGRAKALMETGYFVARVARTFDGLVSRDDRPWTGHVQITAKNLHGCKVAMTRRKGE